jgi:hypothetical protein
MCSTASESPQYGSVAGVGWGYNRICCHVRFEVLTAVTMKNIFWDVTPLALLATDVLEEPSVSIIRVIRIRELGTLAVTSN